MGKTNKLAEMAKMVKKYKKMKGGNGGGGGGGGTNGLDGQFPLFRLFANSNIAVVLSIIIIGLLAFIYTRFFATTPPHIQLPSGGAYSPPPTTDTFNDPYAPPLKNDGAFFPPDIPVSPATMDGVSNRSINIKTRGEAPEFSQIGILTKSTDGNTADPKILPLMGRRIMNGRNKYQYYTISNSGNVNTKLPVSKDGRNCIGEYGCDELNQGDNVFVEGYGEKFKATIYENGTFRYIP
jgi:hypothetical protein